MRQSERKALREKAAGLLEGTRCEVAGCADRATMGWKCMGHAHARCEKHLPGVEDPILFQKKLLPISKVLHLLVKRER